MSKNNEIKHGKREDSWVDDLLERQEHDLEVEEEILSSVPNRIKHKYLEEDQE